MNGTKQGCVLASILFIVVLSVLIRQAFTDNDHGTHIESRSNGGLFNLQSLKAKPKIQTSLITNLLYTDDYALVAHSLADIQHIKTRFAEAAKQFGLTISLKKTEVLLQPKPHSTYTRPVVQINNTNLNTVGNICYLGSISSQNAMVDEIRARIRKSSASVNWLNN